MDEFEPPPRRAFIGVALALTAVLGVALAMQPVTARADASVDPMLDPDERKRLRRELRQAHRERMRQAREAQISEASGGAHHAAGTTHPEASPHHEYSANRAMHHGAMSRPREALHPGMQFSEEEREQLRRQLRAQRAQRRETDPRQAVEAGGPATPVLLRD